MPTSEIQATHLPEKNQREFRTEAEVRTWYNNYRWFHARLAELVARFLEFQIERFFAGNRLPLLARISHREKTLESLERNLKYKKYSDLPIPRERLSDIAGVRAVFYFRDDVKDFCDKRANLFREWFGAYVDLSREFNTGVESESWVGLDPAYRSWHFTLRVDPDTKFYETLNEMDQAFLSGLYCEVQLRTTLQDAWAQANHDIRYKMANDVNTPRNAKAIQAFRQLAEQLHSGDDTLVSVKSDYKENVEESVGHRSSPSGTRQHHWAYKKPRYNKAAVINGVNYDYELLDPDVRQLQADHLTIHRSSRTPFLLDASTTLFDVDHAFRVRTGVSNYKREMWELLKRTEAQFVVAISYDSMVVRATDWQENTRTLSVELAAYSDQVVTNHKRSQNKVVPGYSQRVEELAVDENGALLSFGDSPLANTVGVCCVIRTAEGDWAIGLRAPSVAFDPGLWGCPASGALNWIELGSWEGRDFDGWVKNGIVREVAEELGYTPESKQVHYLGLAREFGRMGKPQIFFFVQAKIGRDKLLQKFQTYKRFDSEYQTVEFLSRSQVLELIGDDAKRVNGICAGAEVSEELRFNLALAMHFFGEIPFNRPRKGKGSSASDSYR